MDDNGDIPETGQVVPFPGNASPNPPKPKKERPGGHKRRKYYEALARGDMAEAERLKPGRVAAEIRAEVQAKHGRDPQVMDSAIPWKGRKPNVVWSQAVADEIVGRLLSGEPLARICDDRHMPDYMNVWRWERDKEEFRLAIAAAKRDGTHYIADDCIKIADDLTIDPAHKRVMVDTRLRLIKSWHAKAYGDQLKVTGEGEGGTIKFIVEGLKVPDKQADAIDVTPRKNDGKS